MSLLLNPFSDGMSRSGVFITCMTEIERIKVEGGVDIFQTVKAARTQRPHMVNTSVSYCSHSMSPSHLLYLFALTIDSMRIHPTNSPLYVVRAATLTQPTRGTANSSLKMNTIAKQNIQYGSKREQLIFVQPSVPWSSFVNTCNNEVQRLPITGLIRSGSLDHPDYTSGIYHTTSAYWDGLATQTRASSGIEWISDLLVCSIVHHHSTTSLWSFVTASHCQVITISIHIISFYSLYLHPSRTSTSCVLRSSSPIWTHLIPTPTSRLYEWHN